MISVRSSSSGTGDAPSVHIAPFVGGGGGGVLSVHIPPSSAVAEVENTDVNTSTAIAFR